MSAVADRCAGRHAGPTSRCSSTPAPQITRQASATVQDTGRPHASDASRQRVYCPGGTHMPGPHLRRPLIVPQDARNALEERAMALEPEKELDVVGWGERIDLVDSLQIGMADDPNRPCA